LGRRRPPTWPTAARTHTIAEQVNRIVPIGLDLASLAEPAAQYALALWSWCAICQHQDNSFKTAGVTQPSEHESCIAAQVSVLVVQPVLEPLQARESP
jgi:hypothetical protein